jgi:hypothetical protein
VVVELMEESIDEEKKDKKSKKKKKKKKRETLEFTNFVQVKNYVTNNCSPSVLCKYPIAADFTVVFSRTGRS